MRRIVSILILFIFLISGITGCASKTGDNTQVNGEKKQEVKGKKKASPRNADLNSLVTEIGGNEVTVKIIQLPEDDVTDNSEKDKSASKEKKETKDVKADKQKESKSKPTGTKNEEQNLGEKKYTITDEIKTFTIPVGIPITMMTRGDKAGEEKAAEIKDIKKGNLLQIWYSEKDKSAISKINIIILPKNMK